GSRATVIVFGELACVHPRILLMLHEAVDTFYNYWPDHSCLWILIRPATIMKVSCARAPCPRGPAGARVLGLCVLSRFDATPIRKRAMAEAKAPTFPQKVLC